MKANQLVKIRDLLQREKTPSFLKSLDLYGIEDGMLIGISGSLGCGFYLEGRDLLLKSKEELPDFERRLKKCLNSLPEGIQLHFLVRAEEGDEKILKEYKDSIKVENFLTSKFIQAKLSLYEKNPFLKREIFLFVILPEAKLSAHFSSFLPDLSSVLGKKAHRISHDEYENLRQKLFSQANDAVEGFRDLGFKIRSLSEDEICEFYYDFLNSNYARTIYPFEPVLRRPAEELPNAPSLRSRMLLSIPRIEFDYFYLGGVYHRALNLLEVPEYSNLKILKDFEHSLGKNYFLSVTLTVPDQEKEKSEIKKQGNFAKAKSFYSRSKDHEALAKSGETDRLLEVIAESSDKLFYISFSILLRHRNLDILNLRSREALRAFRKLGESRGIEDHMNHDRLFLSCLPLQGGDNPLSFLVPSETAGHLIPLQAGWRGTEKIGLLLRTRHDEPLRFDLFDGTLQAKHAVMLGTTGSGKSFFTNHLLLHFLLESNNHEIIVIDLGGSYRKLAHVLEGSYLEVECSDEYALNPFPAKEILFPSADSADSVFLQFLKELLQKMIAPAREWLASEKMILEKAIQEGYQPLSKSEAPLLGDIERVLRNFSSGDEEDRKKAYSFAKELTLFTEGEYGKILNRKGRFDFFARFTVFDLRKISQYPELQEILLLIIPFALRRKFENLNLKKILVLDECWHLLKGTQGTDLIELFYRTARKFNGAVLSISQNPEDFLGATIAGVMVNNSPVKYILRLKKSHEQLASFGLNENEIKEASDLEIKPGRYSEVFIKFDQESVVAKLIPNPLEYWISTTDALDLAEESRLRKKLPESSHLEILEILSGEFPLGVSRGKELL